MKRRSIYIEGYGHNNPIPAACLVGGHLATSLITGMPKVKEEGGDLAAQCKRMFERIDAVLTEAGGTPADVLKISVYLKDTSDREALNREWLAMFPDPEDRPARQVLPMTLQSEALVSCELMAVLTGTNESAA